MIIITNSWVFYTCFAPKTALQLTSILINFRGHKRDGEFSITSAYRRKRIDYNKYDDKGYGHEIHRDLFEAEPPEECRPRADSIIQGNLLGVKDKSQDTVSLVSSNSSLGRRGSGPGPRRTSHFPQAPSGNFPTIPRKSAFPTLPSHSSFQGTSNSKRKTSHKFRTTAQALIALPLKDRSVSFPAVPDSPGFILPEPKFSSTTMRQVIEYLVRISSSMCIEIKLLYK